MALPLLLEEEKPMRGGRSCFSGSFPLNDFFPPSREQRLIVICNHLHSLLY